MNKLFERGMLLVRRTRRWTGLELMEKMAYICRYKTTEEINCEERDLAIFKETSRWLDIYFSGKNPDFVPKYKIVNSTLFRRQVIDAMNTIKYGETLTYGDIAKMIAEERGLKRMSAQAVGGAVGWNPICIIIPCHRVVGANGNLTGYGGGIRNKIALLASEKNDVSQFSIPKRGNAL